MATQTEILTAVLVALIILALILYIQSEPEFMMYMPDRKCNNTLHALDSSDNQPSNSICDNSEKYMNQKLVLYNPNFNKNTQKETHYNRVNTLGKWMSDMDIQISDRVATDEDILGGSLEWGNGLMNDKSSWSCNGDKFKVQSKYIGFGNDIMTKMDTTPEIMY
jgi:hypothetical protein